MFRKLDKLIIKAFIGPFIAVFFITVLVLVMQFFWLYIDDFVGKGLGIGIILEFIWYQSASLVPLALPLSVLLASLMTFGNLGETYELVAIKSSGISLLRFMRPVFFIALLISVIAFLFENYVIPVANLRSRTLLQDIVYAKPSFDLKEGVFYDKISGFAIKIGKKEKNDSIIRNVIIYEQNNTLQDNFIVANDGVMRSTDNGRYIQFVLRNGWRYEEKGSPGDPSTDFIRLGFKEYKREFDISNFGLQQRTADSVNKNKAPMYSIRQLDEAIDSMNKLNSNLANRVQNDVFATVSFVRYMDSNFKNASAKDVKTFDALIPDSIKATINQKVSIKLSSLRLSAEAAAIQYKDEERNLRIHKIEWHRKLSMSLACLVLFLIGAPLGSIIRKGGLGSPLIFAIIFFILFFFISTTGEKSSREGSMSPSVGMWLSTIILTPIGFFLIYKAMHDSQLFNKEFYSRLSRRVRKTFRKDQV